MPYTNCSACGAKALVGATRCPRCQAPFVSYDLKGERVPTVNCPNCGVQRPVAIGVCPNCLTSTAPAGARLTRGLVLVGLGIVAIMTVGYFISRRVEQKAAAAPPASAPPNVSPVADSAMSDSAAIRPAAPAAPGAVPGVPAAGPSASIQGTPSKAVVQAQPSSTAPSTESRTTPADPAMLPPRPAPPPSVAVSDSGLWEYAVALTWVRVRSAPSRESDVLRMVDSAQRVRLGPPQNGWRPVRVGVDRGWVDPRLFSLVPASRP